MFIFTPLLDRGVAIPPKIDIYSLMSSYRIQIRSEGKYYDGIIKANNDAEALQQFKLKLNNGEIAAQDEDFYNKNRVFISYEELKDGTTEVNIGETSVGVQVGGSGVTTR
jgi:hypothetical protein